MSGSPIIVARALFLVALFALLAVACGGSPSNPASASVPGNAALAFSRCMRSSGIPNFPDPNRSGTLPKSQLEEIAASNPRYTAAQTACGKLLPNGALPPGEQPTQAQLTQLEREALGFAQCMRSHGVPSWPDYTLRGGQPIFDLHGTSIAPNSPQIVANQVRCKTLLHLPYSPPTSGGAR